MAIFLCHKLFVISYYWHLSRTDVFCCCCLSSGSLVCCVFTCITFLMVNWFLAHANLQRLINISSVIFTSVCMSMYVWGHPHYKVLHQFYAFAVYKTITWISVFLSGPYCSLSKAFHFMASPPFLPRCQTSLLQSFQNLPTSWFLNYLFDNLTPNTTMPEILWVC